MSLLIKLENEKRIRVFASNSNILNPMFGHLMVKTFNITNLSYLIKQNSLIEISKIDNIRLQKYMEKEIRVCVKKHSSLTNKTEK